MRPWIAYEHAFPTKRVRLQFFRVDEWKGNPRGLEGQRLAWADPAAPCVAPLLPSNVRVLRALGLPPICLVAEPRSEQARQSFLAELPALLARGFRLIHIRDPHASPDQRVAFARRVHAAAHPFGGNVLFSGSAIEARRAGVTALHSTAKYLHRLLERPPVPLWGVSCHSAADLDRAALLGADFALLSPVEPSEGHEQRAALGWSTLEQLSQTAPIPIFAEGVLTVSELAKARRAGAAGIAIRTDHPSLAGDVHAC